MEVMMNSLLLLAALSCPPTKRINQSTEPWNVRDTANETVAKGRCPSITETRAPCLKSFTKQKPLTYRAICTWRINL